MSWVVFAYIYGWCAQGDICVAAIAGSYPSHAQCLDAARHVLYSRCEQYKMAAYGPICTPFPELKEYAVLPPCKSPTTL